MNPAEAIKEARRKIDEWVRTRPPSLSLQREYELPADRERIPRKVSALLDKAFPIWRTTEFSTFSLATRRDAQVLDSAFFDSRRQALLDAADQLLESLLSKGLPPGLEFAARSALAYGRAQLLLWLAHIDIAVPATAWRNVGEFANQAKLAMSPLGMAEDEWIDAIIRLELVFGYVYLERGAVDEAIQHFVFVIGWYASAEQLGHSEVVRNRRSDWLRALYAVLDHVRSQSHQVWVATASVLVKDLKIGHYRVRPPFVASRSQARADGRGIDIQFNYSLAGEEWGRAASRLGDTSAFLDFILTDGFLHVWLYRQQTTRHIAVEMTALQEGNRVGKWISPEGSILDPSVSLPDRQISDLVDEWHPQKHHSDRFRWLSHFQAMHVHCTDEWTWDFSWKSTLPTFTEDIWRSIYDSVYGEVVSVCAQNGIRHLIVSPDGSLTAIPHHLLRDEQGTRLGDKFAISYAPNLTGMLTVLDADKMDPARARFVIVQDPTGTVSLAEWECASVAKAAAGAAQVIEAKEATIARIKQECIGAGVLHFTGHAMFDWSNPDDAFLRVGGGERMGLADLRELQFQPGAVVFLSACHTGRQATAGGRASSRGIVSALLEAGVASVVCTLWPVHSLAAVLVTHWFYQAWISERKGRLESLQQATLKLRECSRSECEKILGQRVYLRGDRPFEDEYYWGAFVLYGAW
jgi:CHAT domain-containing protein